MFKSLIDFSISFLLFKLWKYDNTFTGERFFIGVSISNSQKLAEWIYRKVEGYGRPEKHHEPIQHN